MRGEPELTRLIEVGAWINNHFSGIELPADERSRLAAGCFDVALEHQAAIAMLGNAMLHGSMLALIRVLFEAYIRGVWLVHCASEQELKLFQKHRINQSFGTLIAEIETKIGATDGVLSALKKRAWAAMNGFTHTGFHQVVRRNGPATTGPEYADDEIARCFNFAGAVGLLSAAELASMTGNQELIDLTLGKAQEYADVSALVN